AVRRAARGRDATGKDVALPYRARGTGYDQVAIVVQIVARRRGGGKVGPRQGGLEGFAGRHRVGEGAVLVGGAGSEGCGGILHRELARLAGEEQGIFEQHPAPALAVGGDGGGSRHVDGRVDQGGLEQRRRRREAVGRVLGSRGVPAVREVLADEGGQTGGARRGHAGAGHRGGAAVVGGDAAVGAGRDDVRAGHGDVGLEAAVRRRTATAESGHGVGAGAAQGGPDRDAVLVGRGAADRTSAGAGVAGGVEDQEVLVIPHDLVGVLTGGGVFVLDGGVLVVAPGVGVQPRALVVGLEEDGFEVDDRAADAGQIAAVVGEEAGVLKDQLGSGGHAVGRVVGEQVGEVVPRDGAGDVGAVALRV